MGIIFLLWVLFIAVKVGALKLPIRFFASTVDGLEDVLANEISHLSDIGVIHTTKCGVKFEGSIRTGLESLLWLRSPLKIMELIAESNNVKTRDNLYEFCSSVDWTGMISNQNTIKCENTLGQMTSDDLGHTHFNALTVKNAVVDQFRNKYSARPNVDVNDPDLALLLYLHRGTASLYRVWSGESSMHKRGYRDMVHKAALRETTAAALLMATGWSPHEQLLCDPMCGSGTFAIEAALIAANTAPGLIKFGASGERRPRGGPGGSRGRLGAPDDGPAALAVTEPSPLRWHGDTHGSTSEEVRAVWEEVLQEAIALDRRRELNDALRPPIVQANDCHPGAIELAVRAAGKAGVHRMIEFSCKDVGSFAPRRRPDLVITNPPWDRRLEGAEEAWGKLGTFVRDTLWLPHAQTQSPAHRGPGPGPGPGLTAAAPVPPRPHDVDSMENKDTPAGTGTGTGVGTARTDGHQGESQQQQQQSVKPPVVWALTGNEAVVREMRIPPTDATAVYAAGTDLRFLRFSLQQQENAATDGLDSRAQDARSSRSDSISGSSSGSRRGMVGGSSDAEESGSDLTAFHGANSALAASRSSRVGLSKKTAAAAAASKRHPSGADASTASIASASSPSSPPLVPINLKKSAKGVVRVTVINKIARGKS